jgi:hypothetical protein
LFSGFDRMAGDRKLNVLKYTFSENRIYWKQYVIVIIFQPINDLCLLFQIVLLLFLFILYISYWINKSVISIFISAFQII